MSEFVLALSTLNDRQKALEIAKILVEEKLCACVNITSGVNSVYYWDGKIENDEKFLMIIKTRKNLFDELKTRIQELHPYEVPEIICTEITDGNSSYLKWLDESVKK